jgi:hypothetical protein
MTPKERREEKARTERLRLRQEKWLRARHHRDLMTEGEVEEEDRRLSQIAAEMVAAGKVTILPAGGHPESLKISLKPTF